MFIGSASARTTSEAQNWKGKRNSTKENLYHGNIQRSQKLESLERQPVD